VSARFTELFPVRGEMDTPHTTQESHVRQMRESTCSSYVLLIVDRRNITGRHQTGNAWGYVSECQSLTGISLLEPIEAMFMALGPVPSDEFRRIGGCQLCAPMAGPEDMAPPGITRNDCEITGHSW
jgi:hypothetical protein